MRDLTTFDHVITLDIETFYSSDYSLRKMTMTEYIQHPQFKLHSIAIKDRDGETRYYDTDHVPLAIEYLKSLRNWAMVGQNTQFDAAALNWHYGIKPDFYYDTMSMGKGFWPTESSSLKELALRIFPNDLSKRKGEDLINFLGVETLTPEQHIVMKRYNIQDVDLTWDIFKSLMAFNTSPISSPSSISVSPFLGLHNFFLPSWYSKISSYVNQYVKIKSPSFSV